MKGKKHVGDWRYLPFSTYTLSLIKKSECCDCLKSEIMVPQKSSPSNKKLGLAIGIMSKGQKPFDITRNTYSLLHRSPEKKQIPIWLGSVESPIFNSKNN